MFAHYLQGRMGPKTPTFSRQTIFTVVVFFTLLIWSWQIFGSSTPRTRESSKPSAPIVDPLPPYVKPRYWSASHLGGLEGIKAFPKPDGLNKIVAIIFYGRPATVSILDCYLKRNLIKNGGMLDEVVWIVRTNDTSHKAYLDVLLAEEDAYTKWNVTFGENEDYRSAYDRVQNGTMYIKIDDDIVFMEDTVIPSIVDSKWKNPDYFIISANIMNQPSLSWVHWRLGAVRPYLPEIEPAPPSDVVPEELRVEWKASALPDWTSSDPEWIMSLEYISPYKKHRWLPVKYDTSNRSIDDTPIIFTDFNAFSEGLWKWTIAAQQHYSFFENLEKNELWRYKFSEWNYNYTRMGIQFVAMMGEDINMGKPIVERDDEYYFSEVMTQKTSRHGVVDGRSLVAHYSFKPQRDGIASTDILDRYRTFADENICIQPVRPIY
ncbi:hypothetical protein BT63DRAFT_124844 [Microthyrium microscopicum]|uniref:Uncharacterized protein n=1 Tax=Microthyrium microscopicum TaxID=703497 RepID=A0A6A6TTD5_9PEZI|nr:hypothetical protein BT63DRAFT_124844 [Microthyrium microscopicum]